MESEVFIGNVINSLPVTPLFKRRKGLRNNGQQLATMSSRFLELNF